MPLVFLRSRAVIFIDYLDRRNNIADYYSALLDEGPEKNVGYTPGFTGISISFRSKKKVLRLQFLF